MSNREARCPECRGKLTKKYTDLRQSGYREFFWFCEECQTFHGNGFEKEA